MFRKNRSYIELLQEPDNMTDDEKKRLVKIKAIPKEVRIACEEKIEKLSIVVMEAETERDSLYDFLNGEVGRIGERE